MPRSQSDIPVADVCMVVEGTYPLVRGGVSSWVHGIIAGMPEVTFSILLISAERKDAELRYELPPNVVSFAEVFIHEAVIHNDRKPGWRQKRQFWKQLKAFHARSVEEDFLEPFTDVIAGLVDPKKRVLSTQDVLFSPKAWEYITERFEARCPDSSFIDFFWTWRAIHTPLLQLLNAEVPPARCYHLVSTGYAGLLGILARLQYERPVILTEHGIYVRERTIDIARADWIYEEPVRLKEVKRKAGVLKELWTNFFVRIGQLTYAHCDEIFTLFGGNLELQVELGCPREKLQVVPNGVKTDVFSEVRQRPKPNDGIRRIGFVGRVVPIKDVKTFIKACAIVSERLPNIEILVCGPTDEEQDYYEDCLKLQAMLKLDNLIFTGSIDVKAYFPKMDVFVLTSISEGQPLTILEAACAGVPTVSSNVGACKELLEGYADDDRALGHSGIITGVGNPAETADAIVKLLTDEPLRQRMIEAGVQRTLRFYRQEMVNETYGEIYQRWCNAPSARMPQGPWIGRPESAGG